MHTALEKALELILSGDAQLRNILAVTARMSLSSSLLSLLAGVPLGIWLGACRFRGRGALVVLNRTLMGMPPVVCGLLFYLLFSGVGPFRGLRLLFTVRIMVLAQVVLITPLVTGSMESYVSGLAGQCGRPAAGLGLSAAGRSCSWSTSAATHMLGVPAGVCPGLSRRWGPCPWWGEPSPGRPT